MSTIKAHLYFCLFKPHNGKNRTLPWHVCRGDWSRTDNCFMQNVTFLLQCGVLVCTAVILCRIGLFVFSLLLKFTRRLQNFFAFSIPPPIVLALGELMAHNKRNEETGANRGDRCCTLTEAFYNSGVGLLRHLSGCLSNALLINSRSGPAAARNTPPPLRLLFLAECHSFQQAGLCGLGMTLFLLHSNTLNASVANLAGVLCIFLLLLSWRVWRLRLYLLHAGSTGCLCASDVCQGCARK